MSVGSWNMTKVMTKSGAAYEEAVISLQRSSIRFFWKEIIAQFKGGYLRYPPKSTPGKLNVGTASSVRYKKTGFKPGLNSPAERYAPLRIWTQCTCHKFLICSCAVHT